MLPGVAAGLAATGLAMKAMKVVKNRQRQEEILEQVSERLPKLPN